MSAIAGGVIWVMVVCKPVCAPGYESAGLCERPTASLVEQTVDAGDVFYFTQLGDGARRN